MSISFIHKWNRVDPLSGLITWCVLITTGVNVQRRDGEHALTCRKNRDIGDVKNKLKEKLVGIKTWSCQCRGSLSLGLFGSTLFWIGVYLFSGLLQVSPDCPRAPVGSSLFLKVVLFKSIHFARFFCGAVLGWAYEHQIEATEVVEMGYLCLHVYFYNVCQ